MASFIPDHAGIKALQRSPEARAFLKKVAREAAQEIDRRKPHPVVIGRITVEADEGRATAEAEGAVRIIGSGWHLYEYGGEHNAAEPWIRPGAQAVLSRYGGHLGGRE